VADVESVAVVWQLASRISDLTFEGALAGYVMALACHAVEFASRRATSTARATAAVPADGSAVALLTRDGDDPAETGGSGEGSASLTDRPGWGERFGRAAVLVAGVGFTMNVLSLITRGMAAHRAPWGNMYEIVSLICAVAAGAWLVAVNRTKVRRIGLFVMFPIAVLSFVGGTVLYTPAGSLVPALQSYWLVIHVLAVAISSGMLMLSGVASAMYIVRTRRDRRRDGHTDSRSVLDRLPSPDILDKVAYRTAIIAFPLFTFAVVAGALWAEAAWGRYWGWDPKETTALITWILYAGYLHARATSGWRGSRAAWISILGFASIMFNLFVVNMVVSGLHSYAGLN
jgi:cytochrome c-type biogenesis protein CcsB